MSSAVPIKSVLKKHKFFFIPLIVLCGLLLFYFGINAVLVYFNLQLTNYVVYAVFSGCAISIICMFLYGIVLFLKKAHINGLYRIGSILLSCLLCVFLFSLIIMIAFGYKPIHVVERNGQKYIANVTIALSTRYIEYYDYKNIFISGKKVKIEEDFSDGSEDPLAAGSSDDDLVNVYYYDDSGHLIEHDYSGKHY